MILVKIGQTIVNFDRVTSVRDLSLGGASGPIVVEFGKGHSLQILEGSAALKTWLDARVSVAGSPGVPGAIPGTLV